MVAAEVVQQVQGVLETAEGHGGSCSATASGSGSRSGADPRGDLRGATALRRSGVQTEVQTAALEALIKELVAKNQGLQSDRTNMVKELEAARAGAMSCRSS